MSTEPTPGRPIYEKVAVYRSVSGHAGPPPSAPNSWLVICNDGTRVLVLCSCYQEKTADWLVEQLQGKPYGTGGRS